MIRLQADWVRRNLSVSNPTKLEVVAAYGDSMEGTFADGDVLLIDRGVNEVRTDGIYALAIDNEVYIKRVQRRLDGGLTLISDNKKYEAHVLHNGAVGNMSVLGRIVWAWRGKKL